MSGSPRGAGRAGRGEGLPGWRLLVVASDSRDPDLAPFVGRVHLGRCLLLWEEGGEPALAYLTPMERDEAAATGLALLDPEALGVREAAAGAGGASEQLARVIARACESMDWRAGPLEVAGTYPGGELVTALGALQEDGWELVSGHQRILRHRKRKRARELDAARRAATGAVEAFRAVAATLAGAKVGGGGRLLSEGRPLRVGELRRKVAVILGQAGLEQPRGNLIAAGRAAAVPHTAGADDRELRAGESLIVDLFPRDALFADCTRTFCVGTPPPALAAGHGLVRRALEEAVAAVRSGRRASELQDGTCDLFESAGYATLRSTPGTETGYVHGLGHGVGYELHELPSFRREAEPDEARFEVGDLFTLEPGLYDPEGGWGTRLEDLFVLTPDGVECLTPLPYDLDPTRW